MSEARPLAVRGLTHHFIETPTFRDVSLAVEPGQVVSVLGPSGSGKTTLLRSIAGFATPSGGSIAIGGVTVFSDRRHRIPPERRRAGMVFQDYALFPHFTVAENIAFGIHRDPDKGSRVTELLDLVGMRELAGRRPAELSGGQQQRVALARALAPRPALLLLDEPFANVDAARRTELIADLCRILRSEGTSALLVTHNRSEALAMSDRVAVLGLTNGEGRLLQLDTPEVVYRKPADEEAARITGEAQFIAGEAHGHEADTPLGRVPLIEGFQGAVQVLLRPDSLVWDGNEYGGAVVTDTQYVGAGYRLSCQTPAGELGVERTGSEPTPVGSRGTVSIRGVCWAFAADRKPE